MTRSLNEYLPKVVLDPKSVTYTGISKAEINDFANDPKWLQLKHDDFFANVSPGGNLDSFSIITIDNLEIVLNNEGDEELIVDDHSFLIDVNQSYFHCLYDNFGQWLILKNYLPYLKAVCINTEDFRPIENSPYKRTVLDWCEITADQDYYEVRNYKKIKFKKISFIHSGTSYFLREVVLHIPEEDRMVSEANSANSAVFYLKSKFLKKFFSKTAATNRNKRHRKVYLSKMFTRDMMDKTFILKKLLKDNGVSWNRDGSFNDPKDFILNTNLLAFGPAAIFGPMNEIDFRYLSVKNELELEKFFESKGYEIITAEQMTLEEQMNLYYTCTHIATLGGAGSINSLFLDDDGTIIYIAPDTGYQFRHEDVIDTITNNSIIPVDKRRHLGQRKIFGIQNIIDILNINYGDRL